MKVRFSKVFFIKAIILLIFLTTSVVVSFILGKGFAGTLMSEITVEEKYQKSTESTQSTDTEYSPLASPRFSYEPDKYPREQFQSYLTQRPDEEDVLSEPVRVEMTYAGAQESDEQLFDLGNGEGTDNVEQTDEDISNVIESNLIYKVLVKTPGGRDNAENIYHRLKADGYDPLIVAIVRDDEIVYHVQIAALRDLDNANELAEELRMKNYNAWVKYSKR